VAELIGDGVCHHAAAIFGWLEPMLMHKFHEWAFDHLIL
jgi:hypothetical protein